MNWYIGVLKKYADFNGRARRTEFWMFFLINFLAGIAIGIGGAIIHLPFLAVIYNLGVIVPSIAVAARRLHDTGRSGWWQLIILLPAIGFIVLLVFYCLDSTPGANTYGANPKGA
jgi:uncharacterized membrane protein YhaH (DUF805 family)